MSNEKNIMNNYNYSISPKAYGIFKYRPLNYKPKGLNDEKILLFK